MLVLLAFSVAVTKVMRERTVCLGSQFEGAIHHGTETTDAEFVVTGHIAPMARKQRAVNASVWLHFSLNLLKALVLWNGATRPSHLN